MRWKKHFLQVRAPHESPVRQRGDACKVVVKGSIGKLRIRRQGHGFELGCFVLAQIIVVVQVSGEKNVIPHGRRLPQQDILVGRVFQGDGFRIAFARRDDLMVDDAADQAVALVRVVQGDLELHLVEQDAVILDAHGTVGQDGHIGRAAGGTGSVERTADGGVFAGPAPSHARVGRLGGDMIIRRDRYRIIPGEGRFFRRYVHVHLQITGQQLEFESLVFVFCAALINGGAAEERIEVRVDGLGAVIHRQALLGRIVAEDPLRDAFLGDQGRKERLSGQVGLGLAGREGQVAGEGGGALAGPGLQGEDGRLHDFPAIDQQLVALREYDVGGASADRHAGIGLAGLRGERDQDPVAGFSGGGGCFRSGVEDFTGAGPGKRCREKQDGKVCFCLHGSPD